jgi:hypothetical protein
MSEQLWSQVVTATTTLLATALGVGIGWLTTRQQLKWQSRSEAQRRFIEKMEALHAVLTKLNGQVGQLQVLIIGIIGYSAKLSDNPVKDPISTADMHMLVDFYAPSLKPEAERIDKAIGRLIAALGKAGLTPKLDDDAKAEIGAEAIKATQEINAAVEAAKKKLHELVHPRAAIPN